MMVQLYTKMEWILYKYKHCVGRWDKLQWTVAFASLPVGFFKILQCTCSTKLFHDNSSIFQFFWEWQIFQKVCKCEKHRACGAWLASAELEDLSWMLRGLQTRVLSCAVWKFKRDSLFFVETSYQNRRSFVVSSSEKVCRKLHSKV